MNNSCQGSTVLRLATITFDRGDIAFTYDPATGQLTNLTAPGGEGLSFTYDGFLQTGTAWTGTINGSVTRTYDNNFWVTSTSINGGHTASFAYDADGLLTQAGDLAIARDTQNGLITGTTLDTLSDAWTYNAYGEPASYTASDASGGLYAVTYTRDDLGRITRKAETIAGDQMTWDYAYDTAGRLISSTLTTSGGSWTTTYTYDANGNRLAKTGAGGTETGTYDDQDRMLSYGPCTYAYTANGELTTKTCGSEVTSYTYDDFGNLTHVVMPDGITIDYVIDARNRRIGKKVNGTLVQGFLYGDQLNPVAELDGAGNVVARFVYGTKPNVPDSMVKGGVTYRYITDQLGSVRLVVDASTGAVAQRIDYDEYGVVIQDTNPGFQPFGFAGGITDTHTGLIRFGARDYDPKAGRWTSKDPILFLGGSPALFQYGTGDPVNRIDHDGLLPCAADCAAKLRRWLSDLKRALRGTATASGLLTGAALGGAAFGFCALGGLPQYAVPAGLIGATVGFGLGYTGYMFSGVAGREWNLGKAGARAAFLQCMQHCGACPQKAGMIFRGIAAAYD